MTAPYAIGLQHHIGPPEPDTRSDDQASDEFDAIVRANPHWAKTLRKYEDVLTESRMRELDEEAHASQADWVVGQFEDRRAFG